MSMVSSSVPRARHHIGKDNLRNELIILNAAVTNHRMCEGNFQAETFEYLASEMDTTVPAHSRHLQTPL